MRRLAALVAALAALQGAGAASVDVNPAGASVPENLLRIELRFARPQRIPFDVDRLRLLDANGAPIRDAFLDLVLPSADGRRFTVLMNPGRVKTGVGPNLAIGRALYAGSTVRLIVDDSAGTAPPVVKAWTVTAFEPQGPQPALWRLSAPRVLSRDVLVVSLRAPISSSAQDLIAVVDDAGRRVAGRTQLGEGDTVWRFVPQAPWRNGAHAVVTHPELEDPAGNRVCAAFERQRASALPCDNGVTLPFRPVAVRGVSRR